MTDHFEMKYNALRSAYDLNKIYIDDAIFALSEAESLFKSSDGPEYMINCLTKALAGLERANRSIGLKAGYCVHDG